MSGISAVTSPVPNLAQLLSDSESGLTSGSSDLSSLLASGLQNITSDDTSGTTASSLDRLRHGSSSDLQTQVQSAITSAIESAEQSGGGNLKTAVYNALVQVLGSNGINPTTFQATGSSSGASQTVDSTTSSVLSQVLAAVSGATPPPGRPSYSARRSAARLQAALRRCWAVPPPARLAASRRPWTTIANPPTSCTRCWAARKAARWPVRWRPTSVRKTTIKTCSDFCTIRGNEQASRDIRTTIHVGYQQRQQSELRSAHCSSPKCAAKRHIDGGGKAARAQPRPRPPRPRQTRRLRRRLSATLGSSFQDQARFGHRYGCAKRGSSGQYQHQQHRFRHSNGRKPGLPKQRPHAAHRQLAVVRARPDADGRCVAAGTAGTNPTCKQSQPAATTTIITTMPAERAIRPDKLTDSTDLTDATNTTGTSTSRRHAGDNR